MKVTFILVCVLALCPSALAQKTHDGLVEFTSSDTVLENGFRWAKRQALKYVRRNNDPVGPWYEAALPEREAFCMRDVAHQLTGANLLGLEDINKNILSHFVKSISASRDWCGYWEIDKLDRPAPVDYRSDDDFWYNLPGSFDIMNACLRQYQWTGDSTFLFNAAFLNFYNRTCNDYVTQWDKNGDGVMEGNSFAKNHDRGIGSYDESANGITGNDLIAAQSLGYTSYVSILKLRGKNEDTNFYLNETTKLYIGLNNNWWDTEKQSYYHFKTKHGWLHNDPMQLFLLRWNFVDLEKRTAVIKSLFSHENDMNVEMRSYFAREIFRYGDLAEARRLLKKLTSPTLKRREYPEVSFGALEAYADGLMGIQVDAPGKSVATLSRLAETDKANLSSIPLLAGTISIEHEGLRKSTFTNNTKETLYWRACFFSEKGAVTVNGEPQITNFELDLTLRKFLVSKIRVLPGERVMAEIK